MLHFSRGGKRDVITPQDLKAALRAVFERFRDRKKILVVPPDVTRLHSAAGEITRLSREFFAGANLQILPATGTHQPLSKTDRERMFGNLPSELFSSYNFRTDCVTLGRVPASFVRRVSGGVCDFDWPAAVARQIVEGGFDLIVSAGQVVPHEVAGMANYTKNILIGCGGADGIHKSHFLGAVWGMERLMGRTDTPVRRLLDRAAALYLKSYPILYVQTVVGTDGAGNPVLRGLFIGDDGECFRRAAALSQEVNITLLEKPAAKIVAYLDPAEFRSAWLCNKAIYRTRMAVADSGELLVIAPGMERFGEDAAIDGLIRRHGYCGTEKVLALIKTDKKLAANLSAAAHLIHGSSEGRFRIVYAPGKMGRPEIEAAGWEYSDCAGMLCRYDVEKLPEGFSVLPDGEHIFFVRQPALGLWSSRERFEGEQGDQSRRNKENTETEQ